MINAIGIILIGSIVAGITVLINFVLIWYLISRYRARLVWIRDRVDVTDYNGKRILNYINRELDRVYKIQPPTEQK